MDQARLVEGAATTTAMGYRSTCRQAGCGWEATDVRAFRVDLASIEHRNETGHGCYGATYGNIRDDRRQES